MKKVALSALALAVLFCVLVASATARIWPVTILEDPDGQDLAGTVTVRYGGTKYSSATFRLDGVVKATDTTVPFEWTWDTTTASNGPHSIDVTAQNGGDGHLSVTVLNPVPPPSSGLLGWGPAEQDAARAGWTPTRTFTVTTQADFWTRWNDLQAGDRIIYAAPPLMGYQQLHDKRPVGRAEVIGLKLGGTTTNTQAADIWNLTNVHFYDMDVTNPNGTGFVVWTSINSSFWGVVHDTCNGGIAHYNDVSESSGLDFRGLIRNAARPECDIGHPEEPGTGNHGFYLGGLNHMTRNSVFSYRMEGIHAGAGMEVGGDLDDVDIYLEVIVNDAPKPVIYVAGNAIQFWGDNYGAVRVPYIYGEDLNGRVVEGDGLYSSVPDGTITVEYGRGLRCLLNLRDGLPDPWRYFDTSDLAISYGDISPP